MPAPRRPARASPPSSQRAAPATRTLCLALLALAATPPAAATPYPKDVLGRDVGPRDDCGGTPCGANGQLCCGAGQGCKTLAGNVATCVAGGGYGLYTTTWTETRTYTSTIMTHWMAAPEPTAGVDCVPPSAEQQACGPICCAGWQTCAFRGQCSVKPGFVEPSTVVVTSDGKVTTRYSAPFRVTGTTTITSSGLGTGLPVDSPATSTATSDAAGAAPIGADAGTAGGGLSAGAIAGIVIGTLAGVFLLLLLCFCCIARGLWGAIFGRNRRREREERVEVREVYSRRASRAPSAYSRRDRHSGWFGGSRSGSAVDRREKSKSSGGLWLGVAGAATTLLGLLNLKKKEKRVPPRKRSPSRYTYSDYTYTDATSPSSSSSGQRSIYTRRTDSRAPRSQYSRTSRRP